MFQSLEEFDSWIDGIRQDEESKRASMAKKEPRGFFAETASALGAGAVSAGESLAGAGEMVGIPGAKRAREYLQEVGESEALVRPSNLQEGTIVEHPERLADWRWWVRSLGENLPNMAAMMLPGLGALKGAQAAGLGLKAIKTAGLAGAFSGAAAMEAGGAYTQAKKEMDDAGYADDVVERIATAEGLVIGTANGILEMLPFENLFLRSVGAPGIIRRIVRQAAFEGSTEMAQEGVSLAMEQWGHAPDVTTKQAIGRILESGIVGGILGGGAGAVFKGEMAEKEKDQPIAGTGNEITRVGESEILAAEEARKEQAARVEKAKEEAPAVLAEAIRMEAESRAANEVDEAALAKIPLNPPLEKGEEGEIPLEKEEEKGIPLAKGEETHGRGEELKDESAQEGRLARVLGEEKPDNGETQAPGGAVSGGEPGKREAAAGGGGEGGQEIEGGPLRSEEVLGDTKGAVSETKAPVRETEVEKTAEIKAKVEEAAAQAETEPTEAQKEAGNYKKGHVSLQGLDISIEQSRGSTRKGVDKSGKEWESLMHHHYGYIRKTEGKDGDHVDVFIGPRPESEKVFIVNQVNPDTGKFDEHKAMLGFETEEDAKKGYLVNYEKNWKGLGSIVPMDMEQFKEWLKGDTTKEAKGQRSEIGGQKSETAKASLPGGWKAEVGRTRTKEGHTYEAEVDWKNKRIVFSEQKHKDNPDTWNHEIAHVTIENLGKKDDLFKEYAHVKADEWRQKGYDPDWVLKNQFHREEIAMDYGNYLSNPSSVSKELRELFAKHFESKAQKQAAKAPIEPTAKERKVSRAVASLTGRKPEKAAVAAAAGGKEAGNVAAGDTSPGARGNLVIRTKDGNIYESRDPIHALMPETFGLKIEDVVDTGIVDRKGNYIWSGHAKTVKPLTVEEARAAREQKERDARRRRTRGAETAKTFRQWVALTGGVNPHDPDWRGEFNDIRWSANAKGDKIHAKGFPPGFWNTSARGLDERTTDAIESGWLPKDSTDQDFHDAILSNPTVRLTRESEDVDRWIEGAVNSELEKRYGTSDLKELERQGALTDEGRSRAAKENARDIGQERGLSEEEEQALLKQAEEEAPWLFGKEEKPSFELTPSEATPQEQIAARREKGEIAAPLKGEKPKAEFPQEKIQAPTSGKQGSLLGEETRPGENLDIFENRGRKSEVGSQQETEQKTGTDDDEWVQYSIESVREWPEGFENAVIHTNQNTLTKHPDHQAAKAGDTEAAIRLVRDIFKPEKARELAEKHPNAKLVPIQAMEEAGINKIPLELATAISDVTGLKVEENIFQTNYTAHTWKNRLQRLLSRATFDGEVVKGQEYILVEDTAASGGTIQELRHYIENRGGKVVAITMAAAGRGGMVIAVKPETIRDIERKFGREETEKFLKEFNIAGRIEAITEGEGRYLLSFKTLDSLRDRIDEEGFRKGPSGVEGPVQGLSLNREYPQQITPSITLQDVQTIFKGQDVSLTAAGDIRVVINKGRSVAIKAVDLIAPDRASLQIAYGREEAGGQIAGKYKNGEITLARDASGRWTLLHESYHFMEDAGIVSFQDAGILKAKIRSLVSKGKWEAVNPKDIGGAEDRAAWVTEQLGGMFDAKTLTGKIIQKIRQFIDRAMEAFGIRTAGGVARDVESGRLLEERGSRFEVRGREKAEEKPTAVFLGFQETGKGDRFPLFNVHGGERDGSTVSADTLRSLGIEVPVITPEQERYAIRLQPEGVELYSIANTKKIDYGSILPKEVEQRIEAAKGLKQKSLMVRLKDRLAEISTQRQHFPKLQSIADKDLRFRLADMLRQHQEVPQSARARAVREIQDILRPLSKDGYEVYRRNIILADMVRDIDQGLTHDGKLPFGFKTVEEVKKARDQYRDLAEANPEVKKALEKRQALINDVKRKLVDAKLLKKEVLQYEDYFHHQVLMYWEGKGTGTGSADVRTHWRPWMAARTGSMEDYNTQYAEAEFMALSQQYAQLATVETLNRIKEEADVYKKLERQAKAANLKLLPEVLKEKGVEIPVNKRTGQEDPLLPYKQKIAMANTNLAKMAAKGELEYDSEWGDFVDELAEAWAEHKEAMADLDPEDREPFRFDDPRWFHFLSYLVNTNKPGAQWAATVLKTIKERDRFIKETLGDQFKTYQHMIPEGYVEWKPDPKKGWFWANTISDSVIRKLQSGELDPNDMQVKQVLAKGRDLMWVIPKGLAETLDNFKDTAEPSHIGRVADAALRMWKQWVLINPFRLLRYNLNNTSGDVDAAFAYNPKILKHARQAFADLYGMAKHRDLASNIKAELADAEKRGVIGSGWSVQEVADIIKAVGQDKLVRDVILDENPHWFSPATWGRKYWAAAKEITALRENVLRLAAFRHFQAELAAGKAVYGASKPEEINAIKDRNDKAAKLSRELMGDYGNISQTGQYIRKRLFPFWAWVEINAPRYVYMMRNIRYENREPGSAKGRLALVGGRKAVMSGARFAASASALSFLVSSFNGLFFPDEEEELGEAGRRQLHLILGRREDGSIMTLRFQGAFSDALSFFALENWPNDLKQILAGRRTVLEKLRAMPLAALNRIAQGIRPEVKMFAEVATGKALYPDISTPRPIRDTAEYIARTFSLDSLYRKLAGKPTRQESSMAAQFLSDISTLLVYQADPGEQAYYGTRKAVFDWLEEKGIERSYGATPTSKGNALYYYRQALKYRDFQAAEKYLTEYYELGGTRKDLKRSIDAVHPLANIPKRKRPEFKKSLDEAETRALTRAVDWYNATYRRKIEGAPTFASVVRKKKEAEGKGSEGATGAPVVFSGNPGSDVVSASIEELKKANELHIGPPSRTVNVGGVSEKLSTVQYDRFLKDSSALAEPKLIALVQGDKWGDMPATDRADVVEAIIRNARRKAIGKIKRTIGRETETGLA